MSIISGRQPYLLEQLRFTTLFVITGSTLTRSNVSMNDLPNLPGIRRAPSRIVLKAREELRLAETRGSRASFQEEPAGFGEDDDSFTSYFDQSSKFQDMTKSISAFPSSASSFNDINGRYGLKSQQKDRLSKSRSLPFCSLDSAPPFVVNSTESVCHFLAYFTESIPENLSEPVRSRKVEILFYMEDNTLEIIEPREHNSGLTQGRVLKRHQVMKSRSSPSDIYLLSDFKAGAEISIYDRVYTVMSCDNATKRYLEDIGEPFGEFISLPSTYYNPKTRSRGKAPSAAISTADLDPADLHSSKKITGFHQYGRQVLRFYGVWDSKDILFGDELQVRLHYILADDTIEILPVYSRNSGRDRVQMLLKRTKVMKHGDNNSLLDSSMSMSQLSRPGSSFTEGGFDNEDGMSVSGTILGKPQAPTRAYHWTDLHIGDHIPVAAMNVLLIDADGFTRDFYANKGYALGSPIVLPTREYMKFEVAIPPHTGFGSEIDSLTSCKGSLIPMPPHKDGAKLKQFQGMVLRYLATLAGNKVIGSLASVLTISQIFCLFWSGV